MSKLGVRKDQQQNMERQLKTGPSLASYLYDGPRENNFGVAGRLANNNINAAARIDTVRSRLQRTILDRCSNPSCSESAGTSTLSDCSACHTTRYCSKDCQKAHWSAHKEQCRAVRKARELEEANKQQNVLDALKELGLESSNTTTSSAQYIDAKGEDQDDDDSDEEGEEIENNASTGTTKVEVHEGTNSPSTEETALK